MTRFTLLLAACMATAACSPAAEEVSPPSEGEAVQEASQPEIDLRSEEEKVVAAAASQDSIPARFQGKWAESAEACAVRSHQQYRIGADEVGFFESRGIVQTVRVDGDYAAATLSEQYGDAPPAVYVFYMAREGEDAMRLRYDKGSRINVVRCPEE